MVIVINVIRQILTFWILEKGFSLLKEKIPALENINSTLLAALTALGIERKAALGFMKNWHIAGGKLSGLTPVQVSDYLASLGKVAPVSAEIAAASTATQTGVLKTAFNYLIKNPLVLAALIITSDTIFWAPKMVADGLKAWGLGEFFEGKEYPEAGVDFNFQQLDDIVKSFHEIGATNLIFVNEYQLRDLTPTNLQTLQEQIKNQLIAKGKTPTRDKIMAEIPQYIRKGEELLPKELAEEKIPIYRESKTTTAKPKIFLGVVMAGRVAGGKELIRQIDDEITSNEDLRNDIKINLTNWLAHLGQILNYEIQVKYNPFDEFGTRKMGYWLTLAFYITNNYGKRMFIDEILLGPVNPVKYWPEASLLISVSKEIATTMAPVEIKPQEMPGGEIITVTETGETVKILGATISPEVSELEKKKLELEIQKTRIEKEIKEARAKITIQPPVIPTTPIIPTAPVIPITPVIPTAPVIPFGLPVPGNAVVYNTEGAGLRIRTAPGTTADIKGKLPDGSSVYIFEYSGVKDGYHWFSVNTVDYGRGYVAGEYLRR